MLELNKVISGYGHLKILKGISLRIEKGQIVTLIGANGAGKTTTLNTVCGVVRRWSGSILFEEEDIGALAVDEIVKRGITQVPEGRKLFTEMTVRENLEMGAYLRRDRDEIKKDMQEVCELFPILAKRQKQEAGSLSGGEQQMLAIARGMMARPRVLLLDEPSLGLAPMLVEQIFKIIQEINRRGTTIFLVEQNAHMALSIAHKGYALATGEIILSGTGEELLHNDQVRKAYLGDY
ncbi:MAG: ABC transporter ATP-binding protein [bacterium]